MATYAEIRARIAAEMDREDIEDGEESAARLVQAINSAIEFYSAERFWFNQASAPATTTASDSTLDIPAALRSVEMVAQGVIQLEKVPLASIFHETATGSPLYWAENGSSIRLHPIPDTAYTLSLIGTAEADALSDDSDTNNWTDNAADLICAYAAFYLCRGVFRDPEGATMAMGAAQEALTRLRKETMRRRATDRRTNLPLSPSTFNINRGY